MPEVLVIGGGAAGLMAAVTAAKNGGKVVLLERNEKVGRKIMITGKGRCNVTNDCADLNASSRLCRSTADFFTARFRASCPQIQ